MSRIVLDLNINGVDVSSHEIVVRVNGCSMNAVSPTMSVCNHEPNRMFGEFITTEVHHLMSCQRLRSAEIHRSVCHQFLQWRGGTDIALPQLSASVIEAYEAHLRSRGLSLNTISFHMRVLRSCYNKAIEEYGLESRHPFKRVYTGIGPTNKRALSIEAIRQIKHCPTTCREEAFARDMFMFSFYCRGMSFVDMAYLKRGNVKNGWLYYKRHKTGQSIAVKWEQCMQDIVDRYSNASSDYLLPIIHTPNGKERNQYRGIQHKVNKSLKLIASRCGLGSNLTMYVARHSWANAANSLNHPLELISYGMGHTSTKTTKIYLQTIEMSQVDQLNTAVLQEIGAL